MISELKKCSFHYHHHPELVLVLISIRTMIICLLFAKVHCNFDSQPIQRLEQVTILLNGYSCSMYREMLYEVHTCWKPEKTQCLPNWLQPLYLMRERALCPGRHFRNYFCLFCLYFSCCQQLAGCTIIVIENSECFGLFGPTGRAQ